MDGRKEYWIKLFIKKCVSLNNHKEQINFFIEWCSKTYSVSEDSLEKLREKYTTDDYIGRLIPIIDKHFTIEDLKESIKFYSTEAGKKLLDYHFLKDLGKVGKNMGEDIEEDFAKKNNRYEKH